MTELSLPVKQFRLMVSNLFLLRVTKYSAAGAILTHDHDWDANFLNHRTEIAKTFCKIYDIKAACGRTVSAKFQIIASMFSAIGKDARGTWFIDS